MACTIVLGGGMLAGAAVGETGRKPNRSIVNTHPGRCRPRHGAHPKHGCSKPKRRPPHHRTPGKPTTTPGKPTGAPGKPTSGTTTTGTLSAPTTIAAPPPTTSTSTPATTTTAALPNRLEVDENDTPFSLFAGHPQAAAGSIEFNVYNYGQDAHTFAIVRGGDLAGPQLAYATVPAAGGASPDPVVVDASLPPGTYTLFCTLPGHAAAGMQTTLTVR